MTLSRASNRFDVNSLSKKESEHNVKIEEFSESKKHEHSHHRHHHEHHHRHHTIKLIIVVNGKPTEVEANLDAPLLLVIPVALKQTGNEGQPPENWELKDIKGDVLDLNKKIEEFHFPCDVKLFLSLKAGIGGHCGNPR